MTGLRVGISTLWRALKRLGYSHKRRSAGAAERDEFQRAAWRVMGADQTQADRFVFVDEMGSNTSLYPLCAWPPRGERARCSVPRNRGKNTTLIAGMTTTGMGPSLAIEGSTDAVVFETYVKQFLAPDLQPGQVVVMDNLGAHKGERVRELVKEAGRELLYLPAYSPDLNPIEEVFAKIKAFLRKAEARTREMLTARLGLWRSPRLRRMRPAASSSTAATVGRLPRCSAANSIGRVHITVRWREQQKQGRHHE